MKGIIASIIIGLIGGILGTILLGTTDGIGSILTHDYTLGGAIIGLLGGLFGSKVKGGLGKNLIFSVILGLAVYLVFGLISGYLGSDLIAGGIIGLLVGLASHFFKSKVTDLVESVDDKIDNTFDRT